MILETIVTTVDRTGQPHIAPMGVHTGDPPGRWVILPFRPSRTLDNLIESRCAAINATDDVRIFAGCLTGRRNWPLLATEMIQCQRLRDGLAHIEVKLLHIEDDPQRPRLHCQTVHQATHGPFAGFNRAQNAVLEAAILVSRLDRLPWEKIDQELTYLESAVHKTAGPREQEAWAWLMEALENHLRKISKP